MFPEQPVPKDVNDIKNQSSQPLPVVPVQPQDQAQSQTQQTQPLVKPINQTAPTAPTVPNAGELQVKPTNSNEITPPLVVASPISGVGDIPIEPPTPASVTSNAVPEFSGSKEEKDLTESLPLSITSDTLVPASAPTTVSTPTPTASSDTTPTPMPTPMPATSSDTTPMPISSSNTSSPQQAAAMTFSSVTQNTKSEFENTITTAQIKSSQRIFPKIEFNFSGLIVKLILVFILVIPIIVVGTGVGVAYGFINIGNTSLQNQIQKIVFSVSFLPKSPKYVLQAAFINQSSITDGSFELTLSASDMSELLYTSYTAKDNRIILKGLFDNEDTSGFKFNVLANIFGIFKAEISKIGSRIYVSPQALPDEFFSLLQMSDQNQKDAILDKWIYTESPGTFNRSLATKEIFDDLNVIEPVLLKFTKMSSEKDLFLFEIALDKNSIKEIYSYLEEYYKKQGNEAKAVDVRNSFESYKKMDNTTIKISVDKNSFFIKDIQISTKVEIDPSDVTLPDTPISGILPFSGSTQPLDLQISYSQKELNKGTQITEPSQSMSFDDYLNLIKTKSPLFVIETAKVEYTSIKLTLEGFKQDILAYYLEKSVYPDTLDPLKNVDIYKKLEEEKLAYYRKLDLTHWGFIVAVPDPEVTYTPQKVVETQEIERPTREKPYMVLIFIANAADPQVQYYSASELANIAPDVVLRKMVDSPVGDASDSVVTPDTETTTQDVPATTDENPLPDKEASETAPQKPEVPDDEDCDSPFGCL